MTTILAIDDVDINLAVIDAQLSAAFPDARIITALSGKEGIEKARVEDPDVILLDLVMPDMDGFETCSILKNDALLQRIPVIILTAAMTDAASRIRALRLGADAFLTKPADEVELTVQVSAMLRMKKSEDALRQDNIRLEALVHEHTRDLERSVSSALNLMEDLKAEIEERKTAEHALKKSEERYRLIAENVSDMVWVQDPLSGRYVYMSPSVFHLTGYTPEEAMTQSTADVVTPDSLVKAEAHMNKIHAAVAAGERIKTGRLEVEMIRKDGSAMWVESAISGMYNDSGELLALQGVTRDISKRKRMEEELTHTKELAEEANKAKSEFLANMSHEIRTPMNGIIGMTGLLLDTELTAEQRDYAETVRTSADGLLAVVNDILDFSKVEAGKVDLEIIDFNLRTTVEDVIDILGPRVHDKGLECSFTVDAQVPSRLRGDPGRFRQILVNLTSNAIKFTEKGEIALKVTLEGQTDNHVRVRCTVEDTGIGIPAGKMDLLFKSFSQADASTTRKYGGTGLGLAISKQLVELMGGHIGVESREGLGSKFWFTVVFEKQQTAGDAAGFSGVVSLARASQITEQEPFTTGHSIREESKRGIRILVAEDNTTNQKVALLMLRKLGYEADVVADGDEAVRAFDYIPYGLILMDVQMPEVNGFDATAIIRAKENDLGGHVPIIAMTAHALKGDRERCIAAGMDDYISKPIDPGELADSIHRALLTSGRYEEEGIFNKGALMNRFDGDSDLCDEIIAVFAEDFPIQLNRLKSAFTKRDPQLLESLAHTVKGAAANVEAGRLKNLACEIEKAGRQRDMDAIGTLITNMGKAFEKFTEATHREHDLEGMKADRHKTVETAMHSMREHS